MAERGPLNGFHPDSHGLIKFTFDKGHERVEGSFP